MTLGFNSTRKHLVFCVSVRFLTLKITFSVYLNVTKDGFAQFWQDVTLDGSVLLGMKSINPYLTPNGTYVILYTERRGHHSFPLPLYRGKEYDWIMTEDLRGVFYITRGNYVRDKAPKFFNEVSEQYNAIGGWNPEDTTNQEWYGLYDHLTFTCQGACSDFDTLVRRVYDLIVKYRTKERYLEVMRGLDLPVSPIHRRLEEEVYKTYGDYYLPEIQEQEDLAYQHLRESNPIHKARKRFKPRNTGVEMTPPATPVEIEVPTTGTPKKKFGLRVVHKGA